MAIILNGHITTELKLKASDGSEVTKQLSEEGTIPVPTETLDILSNGLVDVEHYKNARVQVPTGGGLPALDNPASAADILKDKEAIDGNGAKLVGTCAFDADTSDADAVASDIAEGKTAYVNGVKLTGTASGGGGGSPSASLTFVPDTTWSSGAHTIDTLPEFVGITNYFATIYAPNPIMGAEVEITKVICSVLTDASIDRAFVSRWNGSTIQSWTQDTTNDTVGITIGANGEIIIHGWSANFQYLAGETYKVELRAM